MHAAYVRTWFAAGIVALLVGAALGLASLAGAPVAQTAPASILVAGVSYLALALALGLVPAFARRDWPAPLTAWAAVGIGLLGALLSLHERANAALLGASLLLGAAQPVALLAAPRWPGANDPDATHAKTDRAALASIALALVGIGAGGVLLVAFPRGLPSAGYAAALLGGALPAAFGALLFILPRAAREPLSGATLAYGALGVLALSTSFLVAGLLFPLSGMARTAVAGLALAFALGITTLLRARRDASPLLSSAFVLGILAALALLLATLYGGPNALLPVALFATLAFALVLVVGALVAAAPILLPGKLAGARWMRWGPALLIAALFLYTPALQYGRSAAPAAIVAAIGLLVLLRGAAPLASNAPPPMRRR